MGWYIIISWSVLCNNWIVDFKVMVTVKIQNFIESLCILYLLYHWSLGNPTRCADVLLLITKPSTAECAYTDSNASTYSVTGHATQGRVGWGYFAPEDNKPCFKIRALQGFPFWQTVNQDPLFWQRIDQDFLVLMECCKWPFVLTDGWSGPLREDNCTRTTASLDEWQLVSLQQWNLSAYDWHVWQGSVS